jgi:hypothetical protein
MSKKEDLSPALSQYTHLGVFLIVDGRVCNPVGSTERTVTARWKDDKFWWVVRYVDTGELAEVVAEDLRDITNCEGYKKLLADVQKDEMKAPGFHDYRGKLVWVIERAQKYAEVTGLKTVDILNTWEKHRRYWYMNYYQESNQPLPTSERVRILKTRQELLDAIGEAGFRCPACGGRSTSPYECDSGKEMEPGKICDWKVYGLLKDLGKGVYVFVKDQFYGETIFMPIAWEAAA